MSHDLSRLSVARRSVRVPAAVLLVSAAVFIAVPGCARSAADSSAPVAASIPQGRVETDRARIFALGLSCPKCAFNIDKTMMAVRGVKAVESDLGTGVITVTLDRANAPTFRQLADAVNDAGFTVTRVEGVK